MTVATRPLPANTPALSQVQWMWADVGKSKWCVQHLCPWRWSAVDTANVVIGELLCTREAHKARPILLWEDNGKSRYFPSVDAALARLQELAAACSADANMPSKTSVCGGWYGIDATPQEVPVEHTTPGTSMVENSSAAHPARDPRMQTVPEEVAEEEQGRLGALTAALCGGWYGVDVSPVQDEEVQEPQHSEQQSTNSGLIPTSVLAGGWYGVDTSGAEAMQPVPEETTSRPVEQIEEPAPSQPVPEMTPAFVDAVKKVRQLKVNISDASTCAPSEAGMA